MKIINLTAKSTDDASNVYLVQGELNAMDDVNTLIDVGRDIAVIDKINDALNGVGKKRIEQVVLTHCHYDRSEILPVIKKQFAPRVCAFSEFQEGIDLVLKDGQNLKMGNWIFEVIHLLTPANNSICLFCEEAGVLFAGDAVLDMKIPDAACSRDFINVLLKLSRKKINSIYFGHGKPRLEGCNEMILRTLNNITIDCSKKAFI